MGQDTEPGSTLPFLADGGEMGARLRAYDWSNSPLGTPQTWPTALKALVGVMLNSHQPMNLAWGADFTLLYNDAYVQLLGNKHPAALGRNLLEVWAEVGEQVRPLIEQAFAGEAVHVDDLMLLVDRRGHLEEAHFSFSLTPVRDDQGGVAGMFSPSVETTAQVLADRRLAEELERQRRLFEQAPGFMAVMTGPELRYEFVNRAYVRLFGERDYLGRSAWEVFPEFRTRPEYAWLPEVYRSGERFIGQEMDVQLQASNGQPPLDLVLDFICEPITDESGTVTGLFVEGQDISERQRTARALRASQLQFSTLAQTVPNLIWVTSPTGEVEWVNQRFEQYAGCPAHELLGQGWATLLHPDDRQRVTNLWAGAVKEVATYESELRLRAANGDYRWMLVRAVPVRDEHGTVLRWLGTNTDIEDQKRVTESQRQLNQTLEMRIRQRTAERDRVWRNSRDLLMTVSLDGIYREVNPAWLEILGYRPEDLQGRHFREMIWPEDLALTEAAHAQASAALQLTNFEMRMRHKDGTPRWVSWHTATENGVIYGYGRHITAEREQAEALRRSEEQLRQAQKMEAVGQLTGGLAHDFNNLLGGIIASLDLLRLRLGQNRLELIGRYADSAIGSAQRAAALVHRLLAFARRQPLDPRPVDVAQLISDIRDLIQRSIGPLHRLEIRSSHGLWLTRCDPNQLESSILNLVINARDAMPAGGQLTIELENRVVETPEADLAPGEYLAIHVSDTGVGMAPEVLQRAAEPFFTTKPAGQGTGLGLSMVYGFAKQSAGHLKIASTPGEGTRVTLCLPRYSGEREAPVEAGNPAWRDDARTGTVLLVEDEPVLRELLAELLQDLGCRILVAVDGPSGWTSFEAQPDIDLLITDIGLPGFDGRQLAARARALRPQLKVLFITGYDPGATLAEGFLESGMSMVTKPFNTPDLMQTIRELLSEGG